MSVLTSSTYVKPIRQRMSAETKYNTVLRLFIEDNCATYDWAKPLIGYIRQRNYAKLYSAVTVLPVEHADHHEFLVISQLGALVLKYPWSYKAIGLERDPESTAILKFYDAEKRCKVTNKRFTDFRWTRSTIYRRYIAEMQLVIEDILGPLNNGVLRTILDMSAYGPGSNIGVSGNSTHIGRKFFSKRWSVTGPCAPYFSEAILGKPLFALQAAKAAFSKVTRKSVTVECLDKVAMLDWAKEKMKYVSSNKVSFVSKTAKTHRAIAVEPLGNSFVQKGIDTFMKRRLKKFGCDLTDQTRNQELARIGSINGSYCTIDLSSASDTISKSLVRVLLPQDWWQLLNAVRSPSYIDPTQKVDVRYEKFASMGNGFCFPLESLIFLAAVRAVNRVKNPADSTHGVYGDDIIVDREVFDDVIKLLLFLGFTPNVDKTFSDGPFRESCGADWYEGQDVRPVYLDYMLDKDLSLRIFHNATYRSPSVARLFTRVRAYLRSIHTPGSAFLRPLQKSDFNIDVNAWLDVRKSFHVPLRKVTYGGYIEDDTWWARANLDGAFDVPLDEFMASRWARWHRDEQRWSWKEHLFQPKTDRAFNGSDAQYWSFLLGSPGGDLYLRRETRHTTTVK